MVRRTAVVFLWVLLLFANAHAQQQGGIELTTSVAPQTGTTDETFLLMVTIKNYSGGAAPFLIGGDDFEAQLIGRRPVIGLGDATIDTSLVFTYRLTPKKDGILDAPAAEVEIDGTKYSAPPIKVKVDKGLAPALGQNLDSIFWRQSLDKPSAYIGEQVVYLSSIYLGELPLTPQFSEPIFDGFWNESLGGPEKSNAAVNGMPYLVVKSGKVLFPLRGGKIELPARKMKFRVQDPRMFRYREVEVESNPLSLDARELPPPPPDFDDWGAHTTLVGDTALSAEYSAGAVKTGESITVTVELASEGNVNPYEKVPLSSTDEYKIYHDTSKVDKNFSAGRLVSRRIFRFSVVPLKPGQLGIPPLKISYFNLQSQAYERAATRPFLVEVSGSDLREPKKEEHPASVPTLVPALPSEPAPLKYEEPDWLDRLSARISLSMSLLLAACASLLIFSLWFIRSSAATRGPLRKAWRNFNSAADSRAFVSAAETLLRLSLDGNSAPLQQLSARELVSQKVGQAEPRAAAQSLLDELDSLRFAGAAQPADLQALRSRAARILKAL